MSALHQLFQLAADTGAPVDSAVFRWATLLTVQGVGLATAVTAIVVNRKGATADKTDSDEKLADVKQTVNDLPVANGFADKVTSALGRIEGRLSGIESGTKRTEERVDRLFELRGAKDDH